MTDTEDHVPRGTVAPDGRRADDITLRQIWRAIRRQRWLVVFATALGTGGGWVGGQILGPVATRVEIVADSLAMIDSIHTLQFTALRAVDAFTSDQIQDLATSQKLSSYLICTFTRRNDPAAVPPECNQVILDWRRGVR